MSNTITPNSTPDPIGDAARSSKKGIVLVMLAFGVLGSLSFFALSAGTRHFGFEPERAQLAGGAATCTDSSASSGEFVALKGGCNPATPTSTPAPTATANPTPTSTPTPTPVEGYPNASNTGPQTEPTKVYSGPKGQGSFGGGSCYLINQDMDGYIFNGCVFTKTPGVTISNSRIVMEANVWGFWDDAGGATFEYNDIIDTGSGVGNGGVICGDGTTVYRNNFEGWEDPLKCQLNSQILENYIHDIRQKQDGHSDILQAQSGGSNLLFKGNTVSITCTGVIEGCNGIILQNGHSNSVIEENYFERYDGPKTGYLFHATGAGGNIIVRNNLFNCDQVLPKYGGQFGLSPGATDGGGNRCQ